MRISIIFLLLTLAGSAAIAQTIPPATAPSGPTFLFARSNLTAWCVVPFDAKQRGPEERAAMLQRLGFQNFAYDWRENNIATFDAEVEAMKRHRVRIVAWWFPTNPSDSTAEMILRVCKRHDIHPQLWVMGSGPEVKTPQEQSIRLERETDRIEKLARMAAPYGCQVELYSHNGWFGHTDNEIAMIERLRHKGIEGIGIIYNFSHGHWDIDDFAAKWVRMQPYVAAVNVSGMVRSEKLIPPSQGDFELGMLRVIQQSGWVGPIGLIAEQGGDAEVTLANGLRGLEWLGKELAIPKSGGPRPELAPAQ